MRVRFLETEPARHACDVHPSYHRLMSPEAQERFRLIREGRLPGIPKPGTRGYAKAVTAECERLNPNREGDN